MKNWRSVGFVILMAFLLIATPVAAWHANVVKSGPQSGCPCDQYSYTLTVTSEWDESVIEVTDVLPAGLAFISSTPAPAHVYNDNPSPGQTKVVWDLMNVPKNTPVIITLDVKPSTSLTSVSNSVTSRVKACNNGFNADGICRSPCSTWEGFMTSNTVRTVFDTNVCPKKDAPEFPSAMIPAGMMIGMIGLVLVVRKLR